MSRPVESQPEKRSGRSSWGRQCRGGSEVFAAPALAADWHQLRADSQLVPQPSAEWADDFRRVEVELALPDLEATTVPGYYP